MSRTLAGLATFLIACLAAAQPVLLPRDATVDLNPGWGNTIRATGVFDFNTNKVYNELPLAIYQGGYLERELRQHSLDALSEKRNAAGYVINGRVDWVGAACWKKAPGWRPIAGVSYNDISGLRFTKDQYALAFFGNASYEGEKAILAPSAYTQIRYQTAGFGVQHARSGSYVRLDLVRGQSYAEADIKWASLYTGEDGRVLRTALLGNYFASDTAGSGFDRTNGAGLAISGRWNTQFKVAGQTAELAFVVDDLGFVRWNGNSVRIQKDTLIEFTGLAVENIFALDDVLIGEDQLLDTFGLRYRTGAFTRALPFRIAAEAAISLNERWNLGISVDQRYLPGYVPLATTLISRRFGSRTLLATSISCGGLGSMRVGLAAKHRFGEQVLLSLSTPQIPAFFSGSARGAGLVAGIAVAF